jgi:hypothetical protein
MRRERGDTQLKRWWTIERRALLVSYFVDDGGNEEKVIES